MTPTRSSRTSLSTELRWFAVVSLIVLTITTAGFLYFLWRVFEAGAGC